MTELEQKVKLAEENLKDAENAKDEAMNLIELVGKDEETLGLLNDSQDYIQTCLWNLEKAREELILHEKIRSS